ncbi:MAG: hypothetical protein K9G47_12595, partial [Bacteroidales bacterium]|nr:hypothetical protein [Bacteroidales bacterium]
MRKLLLYVFSATLMLMFSMNAVAQQGSKVNVSSDQEMLEAIDNPNVKTIEVIVGDFYPSLGVTLGEGSIVSKG